jgi:hypothetical protein
MFCVSQEFKKDLEEVLKSQGIRSQAIVQRRETVAKSLPPTIVPAKNAGSFVSGIAKSVGVGANLLSIGATIAGLAAYSVM